MTPTVPIGMGTIETYIIIPEDIHQAITHTPTSHLMNIHTDTRRIIVGHLHTKPTIIASSHTNIGIIHQNEEDISTQGGNYVIAAESTHKECIRNQGNDRIPITIDLTHLHGTWRDP